jgi:hypothetical protein
MPSAAVALRLLLLVLVGAFSAAVVAPARADPPGKKKEEGPSESTFQSVKDAWTREDAGAVVGAMDPSEDGRLSLRLLSPKVEARMSRAQAKKALAKYFEDVERPQLKIVTPDAPRAASTARLYDYTYRPKGRDEVTTRLSITMKAGSEGRWLLDSVSESPRPR